MSGVVVVPSSVVISDVTAGVAKSVTVTLKVRHLETRRVMQQHGGYARPMLLITHQVIVFAGRQNEDKRTKTIRIRPPKSAYFSIKGWQPSQHLAPGLETTFEVL